MTLAYSRPVSVEALQCFVSYTGIHLFIYTLLNYLSLGLYHTQGEGGPTKEAQGPLEDASANHDRVAATELSIAENTRAPGEFKSMSKASVFSKQSLPFDIGFIRDSTVQTKNA